MLVRRWTTLAAILVITAVAAHGQNYIDQELMRVDSPRTSALGGVHAALADDYSTLFSNPGGLNAAPPQFRVTELTLNLTGPIFAISSVIFEGMETDISSLLTTPDVTDLLSSLYASAEIIGPVSFGYVGEGLGFGVTGSSNVITTSSTSAGLEVTLRERLLLSGGFALPIPLPASWSGSLDAGVLLKGLVSAEGGFQSALSDLPDVLNSLSADLIMDEPFDVTTGIGLDLGFRYELGRRFAAGISVANLLAPTITNEYASLNDFLDNQPPVNRPAGRVPQDLSVGFLYRPPLGNLSRYISDLTLLLDYRDILDFWVAPATAENPLLKIGFGTEVKMLEVLSVRAGLSQGLLSAGLGVKLGSVDFNVALFGTELSTEPGFKPAYNVAAGFELNL